MRSFPQGRLLCGLFLPVLLVSTHLSASSTWYEHYERALDLIDDRQPAAARAELLQALELKPGPENRAVTVSVRYIDYLPHLYLAVASYLEGDLLAARSELEKSIAAGVAAESPAGAKLLDAHRALLLERPMPVTEVASQPPPRAKKRPRDYRVYDKKATRLEDREFRELEQRVRNRCRISGEPGPAKIPWYYYYELAVELEKAGDPQRALDAMVEATLRRPTPEKRAWMYGVWFVDYLPYYQIANLHWTLGNWECALDAIQLSERNHEVSRTEPEYVDLQELKQELERKLAH